MTHSDLHAVQTLVSAESRLLGMRGSRRVSTRQPEGCATLSRRGFCALAGAGLLRAADPPLFDEIPAAASRIAWIHENARSREHYLPEALGPGCAFLDYDNDGWMDIYLVNSGPCDFYQPA